MTDQFIAPLDPARYLHLILKLSNTFSPFLLYLVGVQESLSNEMESSLHTPIFEIFVLFLVSFQWLTERYHSIRRYVQASH